MVRFWPYLTNSISFLWQISPSSTVYSINRMGPRTEPCGIPDLNGMSADLQPSDRVFPMTTDWVLLVRYEHGISPVVDVQSITMGRHS